MSNTRRARIRQAPSAPRERCAFCGRSLGSGSVRRALRLKTGQLACAKCRETGGLQRLACGHFALPGARIISENGDGKTFVCTDCSSSGTRQLVDINDFRREA